jgi:putative (di)nucleoside polyphosphate hydrolase
MSQNQYFRAGIGCIIYNEKNEILLFSRLDNEELWQLPQGGQDSDETIDETLWRELEEETALRQGDFETVSYYPDWLFYQYPPEVRLTLKDLNCLGQIHRWFYLKLKPDTEIDITKVAHPEFKNWRWGTFDDLITNTSSFKTEVYSKLVTYFKSDVI